MVVRIASSPWFAQVVAAVVIFTAIVGSEVRRYGLASDEGNVPSLLMSWGLLVAAWVVCLPAALLVASAPETSLGRWVSRAAACGVGLILAWVGALPVALRFFGDTDPVATADLRSAVANFVLLLVGYLAGLAVLRRRFWPRRSELRSADADSCPPHGCQVRGRPGTR